ncbi:MAG: YnbE family lipoprotein [Gammaproteobacteria bacterium]
MTRRHPDRAFTWIPGNLSAGALIACVMVISACSPTVKVEPPREPITINLNIKLDADVRVKLEQQAKQDVASKPIF